MSKEPTENPWITLSQELMYESPWIAVNKSDVINPAGKPGIYSVVHFKNLAIGILALDSDYNTWLVGQYRYPVNEYSWEIPEGGGPHQAHPLDSAKRELLEETGIKAKNWSELMRMHLSNSVTNELAIVFVAKDLTFHNSEPEETEVLQLRKLPFSEVYNMVMNGEIMDAITIAAILKAKILIDLKQL